MKETNDVNDIGTVPYGSSASNPAQDKELVAAAKALLIAMAELAAVKPVVEGYQRDILSRYYFSYDRNKDYRTPDENGRITSPDQMYLCSDAGFALYRRLCNQAQRQLGIYIDGEKCPLLVAENNVIKARRRLIDAGEFVAGVSFDRLFIQKNVLQVFKDYSNKLLQYTLLAAEIDPQQVLEEINNA